MDNEQAQFILSAYRPGGRDADDPHFAEALAQAQRDPELGRWFAAEQALDAALAAQLKAAPVPADLRASILAGRRVIRPGFGARRAAVLALAAAVAVLLALSALWLRQDSGEPFAEFRGEMLEFLGGLDRLDHAARDVAELRRWLDGHAGDGNFVLPTGLAGQDTIGCRVIEWRGRKATLVCFRAGDGPEGGTVHLLVVDRSELRPAPPVGQPQVEQRGRWAVASWSDSERAYLLASAGSTSALAKFL